MTIYSPGWIVQVLELPDSYPTIDVESKFKILFALFMSFQFSMFTEDEPELYISIHSPLGHAALS